MVGNSSSMLLSSLSFREKKKLPPRIPRLDAPSEMVLAMVDFPIPASPFNQKMRGVVEMSPSIHSVMVRKTPSRVPSKHGTGALERPAFQLAVLARGSLSTRS